VIFIVPFMFLLHDQEPPFWAELHTAGGDPILIGDPVVLLDHWAGHYDPDYAARGPRLLEALRAGTLGAPEGEVEQVGPENLEPAEADQHETDSDEAELDEVEEAPDRAAEQAFVAVEYALYQLLSEAWKRRLPVGVYW
jgi:hypothetical protein